jgi:hypothetical protein
MSLWHHYTTIPADFQESGAAAMPTRIGEKKARGYGASLQHSASRRAEGKAVPLDRGITLRFTIIPAEPGPSHRKQTQPPPAAGTKMSLNHGDVFELRRARRPRRQRNKMPEGRDSGLQQSWRRLRSWGGNPFLLRVLRALRGSDLLVAAGGRSGSFVPFVVSMSFSGPDLQQATRIIWK